MNLETIIGLEIHVQLKTKSKMFCGCGNDGEYQPPNTTVCEVCLGHPGVLPVPNKQAIEWAIRVALALNCEINTEQRFDRKHYFYPDLPKAYQISQLDYPIGENGYLEVRLPMTRGQVAKNNHGDIARIGINRLHIEEDAAKNFHSQNGKMRIDYNRGGTPLIEIVTEPDIKSPQSAKIFLQELRLIMRYLGVSDADMEKEHLRCDANISLRPEGEEKLYPKTEIKNLNSFKAVERALEYEILRQTKLWEAGSPTESESTRGWSEQSQTTVEQRGKEGSADYRYFPEPDIPPIKIEEETRNEKPETEFFGFSIKQIKSEIPELPIARRERLVESGVKYADAKTITEDLALADYFEEVYSLFKSWAEERSEGEWEANREKAIKLVTGWLINRLGGILSNQKRSWKELEITPEQFIDFLTFIFEGRLNSSNGQVVLAEMVETGNDPEDIVESRRLEQTSDADELESMIASVIESHPDEVAKYKDGKRELIKFFVGQVMKESKGTANPGLATEILKSALDK